jgi:hypothetical protein
MQEIIRNWSVVSWQRRAYGASGDVGKKLGVFFDWRDLHSVRCGTYKEVWGRIVIKLLMNGGELVKRKMD